MLRPQQSLSTEELSLIENMFKHGDEIEDFRFGYVYAASNPSWDYIKIGCCKNLQNREKSLSGANVPHGFQIIASCPTFYPKDLERDIHRHFEAQRPFLETSAGSGIKKEFFLISKEEAQEYFRMIFNRAKESLKSIDMELATEALNTDNISEFEACYEVMEETMPKLTNREKEAWIMQMGTLRRILNSFEHEGQTSVPDLTIAECSSPSPSDRRDHKDLRIATPADATRQNDFKASDLPVEFLSTCNFDVAAFVDRLNFYHERAGREPADFCEVPELLAGGQTQGPQHATGHNHNPQCRPP